MFKWTAFLLAAATGCSSAANAAGIEVLKGKWISSEPVSGQAVTFPAELREYASLLPGFQTPSTIVNIDGHSGSTIKVVSQLGLVCYYAIDFTKNEMKWKQRDGGSSCPASIVLKRAK